jgi:gliding motility associated protien GldN
MKYFIISVFSFCFFCHSSFSQGGFGGLRAKKQNSATAVIDTTKKSVNGPISNGASTASSVVGASQSPKKMYDTVVAGSFGEEIPKSLRNETLADRKANRSKNPLEYEFLREDDWLYSEFIWREIDAREKMNQSFIYPGKDNTGDQRFFSILLNAIQKDSVAAFSANDDRFTKQLSYDEISSMMLGAFDTTLVQNANFPNVFDTAISRSSKYSSDSIYTFRLKEQWIFDKEASRLFCRIIGIAPIVKVRLTPKIVVPKVLFWIYYPDLRKTLNKYMVYNPKNYAGRMTWEELFESRFFSSYIVKSSNNNPRDKTLEEIFKKSSLFRLLEGENIKERIFNYEQDLWSY